MGAALGMLRQELQEEQEKRFNIRFPLVRRADNARRELIKVARRLVERKRPLSLAEKRSLNETIESLRDIAMIINNFARPHWPCG